MKTEFVDKRDMINPNIRKNYRVKVNESAIVMEKEDSFYYAAVIENISMTGIAISVVNKCKLQEGMNTDISSASPSSATMRLPPRCRNLSIKSSDDIYVNLSISMLSVATVAVGCIMAISLH